MNKINNKVFWLVYGNYDKPESEEWVNVNGSLFDVPKYSDFEGCVKYVLEEISKNNTSKYVIVTDTVLKEDKEILRKNFISNNIINIQIPYNTYKIGKQIEWIFNNFGMNNKMNNDVFFTSDNHFFHNNIIKYCNRPWNSGKDSTGNLIVTEEDVERMNEEMISRWNSVVSKDSIVWNLGDFCLGKNQNENIPKLVSRLNGKINLILGNHDHHSVKFYYDAGFNRVYDRKVIINDFAILSHAPMEFVKAPFFNIFGHVHDCETYKTWSKDSCCVCVERHEYKPVSWKEIERHYEELNSENDKT